LSRIASLGAIFYLVMDIAIHWGVLRHLRQEVEASAWILVTAITLDVAILAAFLIVKYQSDRFILYTAAGGLLLTFASEKVFLTRSAEYQE